MSSTEELWEEWTWVSNEQISIVENAFSDIIWLVLQMQNSVLVL